MIVTDRGTLARTEGEVTHRLFLGRDEDLIRNVHDVTRRQGRMRTSWNTS